MNVNCYSLLFYCLEKGDFYFNISAECSSGTRRERADVTVNVVNGGTCELQNLSSANNSKLRSITKDLCFQKQIFNLSIEERKRNGVVGHLSKCAQNISGNGVQRIYAIGRWMLQYKACYIWGGGHFIKWLISLYFYLALWRYWFFNVINILQSVAISVPSANEREWKPKWALTALDIVFSYLMNSMFLN